MGLRLEAHALNPMRLAPAGALRYMYAGAMRVGDGFMRSQGRKA